MAKGARGGRRAAVNNAPAREESADSMWVRTITESRDYLRSVGIDPQNWREGLVEPSLTNTQKNAYYDYSGFVERNEPLKGNYSKKTLEAALQQALYERVVHEGAMARRAARLGDYEPYYKSRATYEKIETELRKAIKGK